jgi:hypothetical protein
MNATWKEDSVVGIVMVQVLLKGRVPHSDCS